MDPAATAEEENWDDDFEFSPSPRHSPIPSVAPIHAFAHHATRSNNISSSSRGTPPPAPWPKHAPPSPIYVENHPGFVAGPGGTSASMSYLQPDQRQFTSSSQLPSHALYQYPSESHFQSQYQQQQRQQQPPSYEQYQHQQRQQRQPPRPYQDSHRQEPRDHTPVSAAPAPASTSNAQAARKARYSGNSEEDWDLDEPTISQVPPIKPPTPLPSNSLDHPQPRPSLSGTGNISPTMSAFSIPLSIDSSLRNHPSGSHSYGYGYGHNRDHSITGHSVTGHSIGGGGGGGGAASIANQSIGGSSTNFLLHTGRRSVLEMEKGRQQDRERRRLRKKSRPSPGSVPMGPASLQMDDDEFDVYGRAVVPKRYAIPAGMRGDTGRDGGGDGDDSSIERGSSGEDELSELEEELPTASSQTTRPATTATTLTSTSTHPQPLIKAPSRLLNLALNPTKSHDRLTNSSSNPNSPSNPTPSSNLPPVSSSTSRGTPHASATPGSSGTPRAAGIGSRSTTVMTVPATSTGQGHGYSSGQGHSTPHGPSKLVRKVSGSNVLTKSSPHMRGNAVLAKHPPSTVAAAAIPSSSVTRPQDTLPTQSSKQKEVPVVKASHDDTSTKAQATHHPAQPHNTNAYPASPPHRSKALDDCGASIAPSTASHKEKRQSMLSRLGSLKRWGHTSGSTSASGSNLDTNNPSGSTAHPSSSSTSGSNPHPHHRSGLSMLGSGLGLSRPGRDSVSPRVFSSRLPSFLGGSKVDLHASNDHRSGLSGEHKVGEHKVGSDASLARSPGRKYGLLRKPSLVLSNASSSALAPVLSRDEEGETGRKEENAKRGINPFRRVSIQGMKRLVGDHHHHQQQQQHESPSTTPAGTPEKEKRNDKDAPGGGHHHRTISFSALARGKLGASVEKALRQKDATPSGRKSTDGREPQVTTSHANSSVPHTLGRTAALAKAPKPPLKAIPTSFDSSADAMPPPQSTSRAHASSVSTTESVGYGGSTRIPIPSSISTATSAGYQSSATSAAHSSSHKRTTSGATTATTSSQSQASPISASPPFSLAGTRPYQDHQRSLGPSHTREATAKPTIPLTPSVMRGYSAAENTPKPRSNSKPLPEMGPTTGSAATVGRLEGKSAAATAREVREAGMRRGSAGDSARIAASTGSQSRRGGDLKIPARISMRQGSLKRELEAVKEFAASVDELKRLQTTHQSVVAALAPNPKRSSSRASNQPVSPAMLQSIEAQYGIWWECAELLVDLGGAAPPVVAGTPILENQPAYNGSIGRSQGGVQTSSSSSAGHYGTQRSFSSSSSTNDLSSRQLELLKQMLSTPNPTSFNFADPSNPSLGAKGRSGAEFSGSGSDHVVSDPPSSSAHGTKSSINSASSLHDHRHHPSSMSRAQAPSTNYPYSQGTWNAKNRSSATAGGSRPNLSGLFSAGDQNPTPTGKPATRGSSTSRSGSSATGGIVTTDDAEEEASDWDLESSDSGKARRNAAAAKAPSSSTASSSIDISQLAHVQTRLALTPETILPLLAYAREVKARLVDCLEELERARAKSRSSVPNSTQYSSRTSRAPEVGTSTLRRA